MAELMTRSPCPTCGSLWAHLHPTRERCPDQFHEPVPRTAQQWRLEVDRWAGLLNELAITNQPIDIRDVLSRVVADMRRELAATEPEETRDGA